MPDLACDSNDALLSHTTSSLMFQLEAGLNARTEPFNFKLLMSIPEQQRSFKLVNGELGIKVVLCDDEQYLQKELIAAIAIIAEVHRQLPAIGLSEKVALKTQQMVWSLIRSNAPLFSVRHGLSMLTCFYAISRSWVDAARSYQQVKVDTLSYFLQEPEQKTASLIRQHQFYLYWNYVRRLRHLDQKSASDALVADFYWAERADYAAMTSACHDSRVLTTIHMGDFFGAFKCIANELDASRPAISLRRDGETDAIKHLHQGVARDHKVFLHGKDNPVSIVKALRAGSQSLSIMFDLGGIFGETTEVTFFGHRARFVRGPAEMAILGRARIYPFVCFEEAGQARISMESSFLPEVRPGESLDKAVTRVTQTLVSLAETWIRKNPAQWKYLDRLPHYLILDEPGADLDEKNQAQQDLGDGFDA